MPPRDVHEVLRELQDQLAAHSLEPADRELLLRLADDVRAHANAASGRAAAATAAESQDLQRRLSDSVASFEASYPQLSKTLASVIDTLALYNI
jgi:hypothetical protein